MQKYYSLLFFILSTSLYANDKITAWVAPLADRSLLLDIAVIDSNKLVAVGEFGHVLLSSDGKKWQQSNVPSRSTLTSVFFLTPKLGWAVGHDATILNTLDGGVTWHVQQFLPELEKPLFDVVFKDSLNGIAVGSYGLFFQTSDGGQTWRNTFHDSFLHPDDAEYLNDLKADDEDAYLDERDGILPHFNRIAVSNNSIYLAGEIGLLAKSTDFGHSWQKIDEIYQGSFFDIISITKRVLLVCGLRGNIFRSTDDGQSWQHISSDTSSLLNSIVINPDGIVTILGNNGVMLKSSDQGQTFTKHVEADGKSLVDGVWYNNELLVVSDIGIKHLTLLK
mgnify:CR=1 FL=1